MVCARASYGPGTGCPLALAWGMETRECSSRSVARVYGSSQLQVLCKLNSFWQSADLYSLRSEFRIFGLAELWAMESTCP